ncbi:MAG TPA: alanine dehydrogenase [Terriglobales bacterium]|nr:alanine dehydrogenase [Terriglobales bacterium]
MIIGVPKELKDHETRVGLVPAGVGELVGLGHTVLVETGAGQASFFDDEEYRNAGATIVSTAKELWAKAEMVVKVKEPIEPEYRFFRPGLVLFTYLHLAPLPDLTDELLQRQVTAVGYETVEGHGGGLPLLEPMSEVAGRLAVQVGAQYLERRYGGRGMLLGGVPGVPPARVLVIGGGIVGTNSAKMAIGMGAVVTVADRSAARLRQIDDLFGGRVLTLAANPSTIADAVAEADLLIGAVLIPGASAPKIVSTEMVKRMKRGAVIVDVAIDQGGCIETAHPTTHTHPSYVLHDVVHYCVTNMPAAVPRTSTLALTNVTFAYVRQLADHGFVEAVRRDAGLHAGVNTYQGALTYEAVAAAQKRPYRALAELL